MHKKGTTKILGKRVINIEEEFRIMNQKRKTKNLMLCVKNPKKKNKLKTGCLYFSYFFGIQFKIIKTIFIFREHAIVRRLKLTNGKINLLLQEFGKKR